jgi:hypothetical protein
MISIQKHLLGRRGRETISFSLAQFFLRKQKVRGSTPQAAFFVLTEQNDAHQQADPRRDLTDRFD